MDHGFFLFIPKYLKLLSKPANPIHQKEYTPYTKSSIIYHNGSTGLFSIWEIIALLQTGFGVQVAL